jgi:type II restriction/modification system DNA methylase subunit YeeA
MDTSTLKKFAQNARRSLIEQVASKLILVLAENSAARRQNPDAVLQLEKEIKALSKEQVIEKVAYIWFNRFCALRFMDANRYTPMGIVSAAQGQSQPEILAEAKMGHIEEKLVPAKTQAEIAALLSGETPSQDPQGEAYRRLLVAVCNDYHRAMPYLFGRIADYVELLIPDDLLSSNSILTHTREAMTPEDCKNVEVIGWLYQFYISEKKDKVFAGLKNQQKITTENIPAATQLFTPHWIVRYLVENSLGRLWMLNQPESKLVEKMEYYISPEEIETEFLQVKTPEEIKICDPACGSGHMLVYAFDLLYAIYEEQGYEPSEIPEKILTHNLYGIEIDERAGELAAFALTMKAREKSRRFLRKPVQPNICVLKPIEFTDDELTDYIDFVGQNLFTVALLETLNQFKEADNFGSLIQPVVTDVENMRHLLENKDVGGQLLLYQIHQKVLQVLKQADYLSPKYHVVVANPPYMGGKGMNGQLSAWIKENYPDSKSNLFAAFIERNLKLSQKRGLIAMITMESWMFLSSFENLRNRILEQNNILSMAHLGARAFDSIGGEVVSTTAFVLENSNSINYKGSYLRLVDSNSEAEKETTIRKAIKNQDCGWFFRASASDFKKIPGCPIAYWVSPFVYEAFLKFPTFNEYGETIQGMTTCDNDFYMRFHWEVSVNRISRDSYSREQAKISSKRWFPYTKGGKFRRWYGNDEHIVNWENDGYLLRTKKHPLIEKVWAHNFNLDYIFREGASYSSLSSSSFSCRYTPPGFLFDQKGSMIFVNLGLEIEPFIALFNSVVASFFLEVLCPALDFNPGALLKLPIVPEIDKNQRLKELSKRSIELSSIDWISQENAPYFQEFFLLREDIKSTTLELTWLNWQATCEKREQDLKKSTQAIDLLLLESYGLPKTLFLKSAKMNNSLSFANSESDAIAFISYAVGCMFGRYSLDQPGLILANQGETIEDYERQISKPTFAPAENNVIPILDGDWFADDICDRFRQFLRVTFSEDHYEENLKFMEKAIAKDIRKYFLKDFFNDHVKRYKKRPIYWLFSSPKGSFNALIYLHRYRPDTVSVVLNDYLREFLLKLNARLENLRQIEVSADISQSEKTKAIKEITKLTKTIEELKDYERDVLYPLAIQQVQLDLDDGVKVNYPKLGTALKKITGL